MAPRDTSRQQFAAASRRKCRSTPALNVREFMAAEDAEGVGTRTPVRSTSTLLSAASPAPKASSSLSSVTASQQKPSVTLPSLQQQPFETSTGKQSSNASWASAALCAAGPRAAAELLLAVARMQHEDVELMRQQVGQFKGREGERLRRIFRTRAAELLVSTPIKHLDHARSTLLALHSMDQELEFYLWEESDTWPPTAGAEATCWESPTRAFEERVAHLAYKGKHNLAVLARCHTITADLAPRGFIKTKVHEAVLACITHWIETEPMPQLRREAGLLREMATEEPLFLLVLERRLVRRARQAFTPGRLASFLQLVLHLMEQGLEVLDGPGALVVDMRSATRLAPLQVGLLDALRAGLKDWPMRRVAEEYQGIVVQMACMRPSLRANMTVVATERVNEGLDTIRDMVLRRVEPVRVQEELCAWGHFTRNMGEQELLDFMEPHREHILAGGGETGSMLFCAVSLTPGATEVPPEYLRQAAAMRNRVQEIWKLVTDIANLLGDAAEIAVVQKLLSERVPA